MSLSSDQIFVLFANLDVTKESFLKKFGFFYINQVLNKSPYQKHLLNLGINFLEFVNNLDYLHSYIGQKSKVGDVLWSCLYWW